MSQTKSKRLGALIRKRREEFGYSIRQLAEEIGVQDTTVLRLERGQYTAPSPEKLARLAEVLELQLADLYSLIGYSVPSDLPSPSIYLRSKYRDLPARELAALAREVEQAFKRRGIDPNARPAPGEDEQPGPKAQSRSRPTPKTRTKGGTK